MDFKTATTVYHSDFDSDSVTIVPTGKHDVDILIQFSENAILRIDKAILLMLADEIRNS